MNFLEIEDYLQERNVFESGINGYPAHSDSYMTVVNYGNLDNAFKESEFSLAEWEEAIEEWLGNPNQQPPLRITGKTLLRKIEKIRSLQFALSNTVDQINVIHLEGQIKEIKLKNL